jgi:hypothetical protein
VNDLVKAVVEAWQQTKNPTIVMDKIRIAIDNHQDGLLEDLVSRMVRETTFSISLDEFEKLITENTIIDVWYLCILVKEPEIFELLHDEIESMTEEQIRESVIADIISCINIYDRFNQDHYIDFFISKINDMGNSWNNKTTFYFLLLRSCENTKLTEKIFGGIIDSFNGTWGSIFFGSTRVQDLIPLDIFTKILFVKPDLQAIPLAINLLESLDEFDTRGIRDLVISEMIGLLAFYASHKFEQALRFLAPNSLCDFMAKVGYDVGDFDGLIDQWDDLRYLYPNLYDQISELDMEIYVRPFVENTQIELYNEFDQNIQTRGEELISRWNENPFEIILNSWDIGVLEPKNISVLTLELLYDDFLPEDFSHPNVLLEFPYPELLENYKRMMNYRNVTLQELSGRPSLLHFHPYVNGLYPRKDEMYFPPRLNTEL